MPQSINFDGGKKHLVPKVTLMLLLDVNAGMSTLGMSSLTIRLPSGSADAGGGSGSNGSPAPVLDMANVGGPARGAALPEATFVDAVEEALGIVRLPLEMAGFFAELLGLWTIAALVESLSMGERQLVDGDSLFGVLNVLVKSLVGLDLPDGERDVAEVTVLAILIVDKMLEEESGVAAAVDGDDGDGLALSELLMLFDLVHDGVDQVVVLRIGAPVMAVDLLGDGLRELGFGLTRSAALDELLVKKSLGCGHLVLEAEVVLHEDLVIGPFGDLAALVPFREGAVVGVIVVHGQHSLKGEEIDNVGVSLILRAVAVLERVHYALVNGIVGDESPETVVLDAVVDEL